MTDNEERDNARFWRRRSSIGIATGLIIFLASILFYFTSGIGNYFIEVSEEVSLLVPLLIISSSLTYRLDVRQRQVKTGYFRYLGNSLSYLYLVVPFWIMSAAVILSHGLPYVTFLYMDIILALVIVFIVVNVRAQIWKRVSKEMDNSRMVEGAKGVANRMGIKITGFRVIDWSKAKIANAFQAGFLHYYVFVTNFLLENLTEEEGVAIIAHEIAHAKKKHLRNTLVFVGTDIMVIGNVLFVTIVFLLNIGVRIGLAFGIAASVFISNYLLLPFLQRKYEREADLMAASFTDPKLLADSLLKLSKLNNSPLTLPKRWNPSHPNTSDRVAYLNRMENEKE